MSASTRDQEGETGDQQYGLDAGDEDALRKAIDDPPAGERARHRARSWREPDRCSGPGVDPFAP